ncbi:MAG: trypsin-like peptidase domain-containing protein [Spirochaetota bacterium]
MMLVLIAPIYAQSQKNTNLRPDAQVSSSVPLSKDGGGYKTFTFEVPPDTFAIRLSISDAPADLDLYLNYNEDIQNYEHVDSFSAAEDYNEVLFLSRLSDPPLQEGRYYVDVVYQRSSLPFEKWNRLREIPFKLELETISAVPQTSIRPERTVYGELQPDEGMATTYSVEIPEGLETCRIDLFDTTADLDLLVGYEKPALTRKNADYLQEGLIGSESVVLDGSEDEPELPEGTYYITVFDAVSDAQPQEFSLQVSFQSEPPEKLLSIPRFPRSDDELQQAFLATVEVIGQAGRGSGCIVSEDGLLLTNWHVVRGFDGTPSEDVYIAAGFSQQSPPRELFKAEVVDFDAETDLALLQIESGLYGQSLPNDYSFPFFVFGDIQQVHIGQPLSFIGYPSGGGSGSRVSVSLTRGIVSGFERGAEDFLIKTDAVITPGNSGGAAINAYYELIGLPTFTVGEKNSPMGFIRPVSEIPSAWMQRINRRGSF